MGSMMRRPATTWEQVLKVAAILGWFLVAATVIKIWSL
jgi:hypothetical protein